MTDLGDWITTAPLALAPDPITPGAYEIRSKLTRVGPRWEAGHVRYREDIGRSWRTEARLSAWARPTGAEGWPFLALTYLSSRFAASDAHHVHSGRPAWRTQWMVYSRDLIEPIEPLRYPSDYWRDQLSNALGEFAAELGIQ